MKPRMFLAAGIAVVLMALSPAVVAAGPKSPPDYGRYNPTGLPDQPPEEWGVEKVIPSVSVPGGAVRIITDPLVGSPPAAGWVTFWCQSRLGFQYNIGATGLDPLSTFEVKAHGAGFQIVPPATLGAMEAEPGLWILLSSLTPIELDLGKFKSDANGSGGVKGVSPLGAGWAYDLKVVIHDSEGDPVLWGPDHDTNGFIVY